MFTSMYQKQKRRQAMNDYDYMSDWYLGEEDEKRDEAPDTNDNYDFE